MKVGPTERTVRLPRLGLGCGGRGSRGRGRGCRRRTRRRRIRLLALRLTFLRRRLRHLLGALFRHHDVARLDRLILAERVGPALTGPPAAARGVEFRAVLQGVRQRRVGLAADRGRLRDVFAGGAVGEQHHLGRRAQALAGLLVLREAGGRRRIGDREIETVAGPHAHGAEAAALRRRDWRDRRTGQLRLHRRRARTADRRIRRGARAAVRYCGPQLFCASATITERRCSPRSRSPPRKRCRSTLMRSRLPRMRVIWPFRSTHCCDCNALNRKNPLPSHPARRPCATMRSSSACCLLDASS